MDEIKWYRHPESDKRAEYEWFCLGNEESSDFIGVRKKSVDGYAEGTWFVYIRFAEVADNLKTRKDAEELLLTRLVERRLANG